MEYPYGHHRRDEDDDAPPFPNPGHRPGSDPYAQPGYGAAPDYPPVQRGYDAPPPPAYGGGRYGAEEAPYRPPVEHVAHDSYGGGGGYGREDPPYRPAVEHVAHDSYGGGGGYRPAVEHVAHDSYGGGGGGGGYGREEPPRRAAVEHVAHDSYGGGGGGGYGREEPPHRPADEGYGREEKHHFPHFHHHHHSPPPAHESYGGGSANQQQTVRVLTKAREDFSLSVREGKIVLVPSNPRDEYQHWIKDMRYSTKVKDEEGLPSFALVNKVTGEAIKHAVQQSHPVRLAPYNPNYLDEAVLWTESKDTGEGFRCIRMVNNIRLNFDAFHGDEDHGGVRDGTTVVLWEWTKGKNQRWKIIPY